jgi:uncharacterized RDD family membrane protein YckC
LSGAGVSKQHFHAHETARVDTLDGLALANFWQRALGFGVDFVLMLCAWAPVVWGWRYVVSHFMRGHTDLKLTWNAEDEKSLLFLLVYAAVANYFGNGQTPGKWVARIRIVSLTHARMGPWQSFERALGYGASFLEVGFGFIQYFFIRNRQCVHDRIAETIEVDVRKKSKRLVKVEEMEPEAEAELHVIDAVLDRDLGEGDAGGGGVAGGEHAGEV